jgi:hypothetical protein
MKKLLVLSTVLMSMAIAAIASNNSYNTDSAANCTDDARTYINLSTQNASVACTFDGTDFPSKAGTVYQQDPSTSCGVYSLPKRLIYTDNEFITLDPSTVTCGQLSTLNQSPNE